MPSKIGIVLALDGEREFSQGMKNAQKSAKLAEQGIKNLSKEYKGQANSLEALTKKQEALKSKQEALTRAVNSAKGGLANARKNWRDAGKAVEEYAKELDEAERELKQMEAAGKKGTAEYKKQEKAVEQLAKKLEQQTYEYQKADGAITDWETKLSKADGELKQTTKALDKNSKYMDEARSSANGAATSIDEFGKEVRDAKQGTDEMNISLGSMVKNKLVDLGVDVLRDLGRAAIEGAKKVIEVGSQFEATMSKVKALSGASNGEMAQMEAKAKALGSSTKFSASQVGEAFSYMALAGYSASESISAIDGVVNLAAASDMDLAQASDLVTDYLSAFGLQASDATKLVDELAYAQANSNTTTEQLGAAYANCAVNAHANGQSVEDVTAILEGFANQGLKGERAGTALNSMMSDMVKNMKDGKIQIGETAVAVTDSEGNFRNLTDILYDVEQATAGMTEQQRAEALQAVFQRRSLLGVNTALSEGMTNIQGYKQDLESCDGAADTMAKTMQDNLQGKITEFNSAVEGLGIQLFSYFSGPLQSAVGLATSVIQGITKAITPQKTELGKFIDDVKAGNKEVEALLKHSDEARANAVSEVGGIDSAVQVLEGFNKQYGLFTEVDPSEAAGKVTGAMGEIEEKSQGAGEAIGTVAEADLDTLAKTLESDTPGINDAIGTVETAADEAGTAVGGIGEDADTAKKDVEKLNDTDLTSFGDAMDGAVGKVDEIKGAFDGAEGSIDAEKIVDPYALRQVENALESLKSHGIDLSAYWDEENHKLNLSHEEFIAITDKRKNQIIQNAIDEIKATTTAAKMKAEANQLAAQSAVNAAKKAIDDAAVAAGATKAGDGTWVIGDPWGANTQFLESGTEGIDQLSDDLANANEALVLADEEMVKAESSAQNMSDACDQLREKYKYVGDEAGNLASQTEDSGKQADESARKVTTALGTVVEATADANGEVEDLSETIEAMDAASMEAIASAAEAAGSRITEAFNGAKEAVKNAFNINPFEGWEQNEENGMDKMLSALESQIAGFTNYSNNLEIVSKHIGQEVSPEFMKYLQDMGTEGAQVMEELASALEGDNANPDKVAELMGRYADAMDVRDQFASVMALNDVAIQLGLGQLGSSMEEWDSLSTIAQTAIDGLGADVSTELSSAFQTAVETAQTAGVQIPDGLAEGIENAENPEEAVRSAIAQINAAVEGQGSALIKAAESVSGKVPESIASEIAKGGPAAQAAITKLISTIANADTSGASSVGSGIAGEIGSGVESESDTVSTAAEGAVEGAVEAADGAAEEMQTAGQTSGTAFIMGVAAQQDLAGAATQAMVNGAKAAADSAAMQFSSSGTSAGSNFASGVSGQVGSAAGAGGSLGSAAYNAASSYSNSMYSVGVNMGSGLANGIRSMGGVVSAAAAAVVRNAVAAAKAAGEIQSPSRKMKREVGVMLARGMAAGIKAGTAETAEEATTMMNYTFYKLQKWLVKNKKRMGDVGQTWVDDVAYAWQNLAYRAARYNFGVSTYEITKDKNGNKKKVNKDATTYSQEVMRAAEAYLGNVSATYDVGEKEALRYWETVRSQLKRGTQAYYDATKKIKELRESIGSEEVAEKMYDAVTTYYDLSAKAEVQYWATVRKQYKAGTEDRLAADKQYFAAKKKYNEQLKDLDNDYKENRKKINDELKDDIKDVNEDLAKDVKRVNEDLARDIKSLETNLAREKKSINDQLARDLKSVNDQLAKDIESANKRYLDAVDTRKKELMSSFGLFDAFESKSATGDELLFNLQSQVAGMKDWRKSLDSLAKRNVLSQDLINELTAQGPQSSAAVHALSMLSNQELKAYNQAYQEKQAFAQKQALDENKALRTEVNAEIKSLRATATTERSALRTQASKDINALKTQFNADVKALKTQASADIKSLKTQANKDITALKTQANKDLNALKTAYLNERKTITQNLDKGVEKLAKNISKTASDQVTRLVGALTTKKVSTSTATKKGNASGTRSLGTNYAWMNEDGTIEPLIRKSDGAMLNTYAKAGDAIIPAANVGNLYDWSMISPAALARQQAALQSYMQQVTASVSMAALNSRLSSSYGQVSAQSPGYDDTSMLGLMRQMVSLLESGSQIYLDTGALVGGTSDAMSNNFAMRARRRRG